MNMVIVLGRGLNTEYWVREALYSGWQNLHLRLCQTTGDVVGWVAPNAKYLEFEK